MSVMYFKPVNIRDPEEAVEVEFTETLAHPHTDKRVESEEKSDETEKAVKTEKAK